MAAPPRPAPWIAFYGDDFTGATDTLATAATAGLRTLLFLRVPDARLLAAAGPLDVVGIAGASRSMKPAAMMVELERVRACFATLGARFVHYKICSTFDSSPGIGNIGVAAAVLRELSPRTPVLIVGGQPNLGRYCVFGNLFATVDSGGEVYRIDRHETMARHPVTPMDEADLRRHLGHQGLEPIVSVPYTRYDEPIEALAEDLRQRLAGTTGRGSAILFDVSHRRDLAVVGRLLAGFAASADAGRGHPDGSVPPDPVIVIGPSGATQALVAAWAADGDGPPGAGATTIAPVRSPSTPVLVLAGSLSGVTARQRAAALSYRQQRIDPQALVTGGVAAVAADAGRVVSWLRDGQHVLIHTSPGSDTPRRADPALARASGVLLRHLLQQVPLGRVGVAGGDTSSHAIGALDVWALGYAGQVAPGSPLCRTRSDTAALDGIELMLKGGQMGTVDVFERLLGE